MLPRIAALLLILGGAVRAASPHLAGMDPAGVQRGADTDVSFSGDRLQDARGILFYNPGIQVASLKPGNGSKFVAHLHVTADCPLGEHDLRVWTATGISELLPLYVSPFPNVQCSASNHTIAQAQPVPFNSTANGVINNEEIDYYSVQVKKGDRITAEVEGIRLAREMFDPWAAILDAHGRELASDDDSTLFAQDPMVSVLAPVDGTYIVAVRESTWGGSPNSIYRLHIGSYPQPVAVYPAGGQAGQKLPVTFLGDAKGPMPGTVQLPATAGTPFGAMASDNGVFAPASLPMRVSPFPNVLAQPPNGDVAHATAAAQPPPLAFNGIIAKPGERDFFRFHATKGTVLDLTVFARQLRSPLDSVLEVLDAKGNHLADNDDAIGPDSYIRFNVPADGDYCISVRDQLMRGGPTLFYRVEVVPVLPEVTFTIPEVVRDSQERETIVVPRGNRYATMLRVKQESFDGDYQIKMPGLLPGVAIQTGSLVAGQMPVVFEAAPDAVVSATLSDVLAQPADPKKQVTGGYAQTVELVHGQPNNYPYLKTDITQLALSVADEAPFRLELTPPPVAILEDGQASLKVTAVRKAGFTGPINVAMLYNPPGINSQAVVTIPEKQDSVDLPLNANGDAKIKTWQIAVIASADAGQGSAWAASGLVPFTVAKPYITAHLDRANTVQGQPVTITCHLDQNAHFDGKAHIRLMGLPSRVAASDIDVTGTDAQAVFNVTTDPTSPAGKHGDLFCEVTVESKGVKQVANTAFGGTLRIDKPPATPTPAPKKEIAAAK